MQPIVVSPSQLLYAMLALLRSLGLLPRRQQSEPDPEDGGYTSVSAAEAAAHAYVDSLGGSFAERQGRHALIAQICAPARLGLLSISCPPATP